MDTDFAAAAVDKIVAEFPFGRPSAARRGRNPNWPWVPVIDFGVQKQSLVHHRTHQVPGRAFVTRDEAVDYANRAIDAQREGLRQQFNRPECRALRRQWGLPEEIA